MLPLNPILKDAFEKFEQDFLVSNLPEGKYKKKPLTMRDRAILSKFSTHRVSEQCTLVNFQKNFPLSKNGGHFKFWNFCQKWKNTNLLLSP